MPEKNAPAAPSSPADARRRLEAAIDALAPLGELLCAARMLRLGAGLASKSIMREVTGEAFAVDLDPDEAWPTVWLWGERAPSEAVARPMAAWLGDRQPEDWPASFVAIALRAQESAEAMGHGGFSDAMDALGAKPMGRSKRRALVRESASQWLARAAIDSARLETLRSEAKAMGFELEPAMDSLVEARELGRFSPIPDSSGPCAPRL